VRVVATRSPDELGPYRRALAPRFELIALPLLGEEPPEPTEVVALFEAVSTPDLGALWLASARAVAPVVAALQTLGIAAPPAFTVGARTTAAARAAGLTAESVGDDGVAAATALAATCVIGHAPMPPSRAVGTIAPMPVAKNWTTNTKPNVTPPEPEWPVTRATNAYKSAVEKAISETVLHESLAGN